MKGGITLCFLACCAAFIASAPLLQEILKPVLNLKERELDRTVIYALILEANKDFVSDLYLLTQGDILLKRLPRFATTCTSCLWTKALDGTVPVPFILNTIDYSNDNLALFDTAMGEFETLTCVRFVNRTTEKDYLDISSDKGCVSFVGRIGGGQLVGLSSSNCMQRGVIQHELLHALGFYHEISRSDRDNYIYIRTAYIDPVYLSNFNIVPGKNLGLPYDYISVMHYNRYAYTTNDSVATIVPIPDPNVPIGQRFGLSVLDVKRVNKLYNCSVCGYLLNEENGTFSSINFTTGYPNNTNCVWLIRVPYGQVALDFNYFNVQNTDGCVADYVRIYDGPTRNYPLLLDKICGTVQYPTITSSTDQMLIEFVSDGSITSAGFNATYKSVPCGGFFTANTSDITTPGYNSGGYSPNLNCNYLIYAPVDYQIVVSGTCQLELSQGYWYCRRDILTIYPDGIVDNNYYLICVTRPVPTLYSSANQMLINFVSDAYIQLRGCKLTYSFVWL